MVDWIEQTSLGSFSSMLLRLFLCNWKLFQTLPFYFIGKWWGRPWQPEFYLPPLHFSTTVILSTRKTVGTAAILKQLDRNAPFWVNGGEGGEESKEAETEIEVNAFSAGYKYNEPSHIDRPLYTLKGPKYTSNKIWGPENTSIILKANTQLWLDATRT